jgi:hypothetical protein
MKSLFLFIISLLACPLALLAGETTAIIGYSDTLPAALKAKTAGYFKFALIDEGVVTDAGVQATGLAQVKNGGVSGIIVSNAGRAYRAAPAVTIIGSGSGAAAVAAVSGGRVTEIKVTSKGTGYTSPPSVLIGAPDGEADYQTFWSNDGTSSQGSEPKSAILLDIAAGGYTAHLGDQSYGPNMQLLPADLAEKGPMLLRVWYAAKAGGPFILLAPDQRIGAGLLALRALRADTAGESARALRADVADSLAPGLKIEGARINEGSIGSIQLADGSLSAWKETTEPQVQAAANQAYVVPYGANSTFTLPANPQIGDVVKIRGASASLVAGPGQAFLGTEWEWTARPVPFDPENGEPYVYSVACSADGNRLYVRTDYDIFRSTDAARTWVRIHELQEGGGVFCSADGMTIVAANGSQEFRRSRDGGESWALLSAKIEGEDIYPDGLELSSDGNVMAFHDGLRLFLSNDAGNTWSARTPPDTSSELRRFALSGSGATIYAVHDNGDGPVLSVSKNTGESWSRVSLPVNAAHVDYPEAVFVSRDARQVSVIGYADDPEGLLESYPVRWLSSDSGNTWKRIALAPYSTNWDTYMPVAHGGDGRTLFVSEVQTENGDNPPAISYDGGQSWRWIWTFYNRGSYLESVTSSNFGQRLAAVADGKLYTSWADEIPAQGAETSVVYVGDGNWLR